MHQFHDSTGRSWRVSVTVSAIKRVRDLTGVDLLEFVDGKLIERFIRDPVVLVDVVYAVCKPQADEVGVGDVAFGELMAGDTIGHATKALLDEIVAFYPSPRDRANLGRVLDATDKVVARTHDLIEQRLSEELSDDVIERLAHEAVAAEETPQPAGGSSGSAQALSVLTPDR